MESVYHIVTIRVNETSWEHVWRLRSRYLGTGYDTSQEVLRPSEPHLSLSTLQEWTWEHYRGLNLTFFTISAERSRREFIGGLGLGRPTCELAGLATWPGSQVSSLHHLRALHPLSTASSRHIDKTFFGNTPTHGQPANVMWSASHTLAWMSPCFGHAICSCHIFCDYALFWT
jgi:hypothetical protein